MGCNDEYGNLKEFDPVGTPAGGGYGRPGGPAKFIPECIKVEKVYESCRKVQVNEDVIDLRGVAVGEILEACCKGTQLVVDEAHPFTCEKVPGTCRARVSFWYRFRFEYIDQEGVKRFNSEPVFHTKTVILSERIRDPRIFVQCEVFLECLECFPSGPQMVTCCIGKLEVFKLVAIVQLLVPAYGFCPEPDLCSQVETECPDFSPVWPPYPHQGPPESSGGGVVDGDNGSS